MTTNNPPIAAWAPSAALHKLASRHNNAPCILTDTPAEFNDVALVRLTDYEALKAQCEKLREQLESVKELLKDPVTVFVHMKHGIIAKPSLRDLIDLHGDVPNGEDVQLLEIARLRSECEKLRAAMIEAKSYIEHYMYGGSIYREPAAEAIAIIDAAMQGDKP